MVSEANCRPSGAMVAFSLLYTVRRGGVDFRIIVCGLHNPPFGNRARFLVLMAESGSVRPSEPSIIYEDARFLAVNKPAGMIVHHAKQGGGGEEALTDWLLPRYPELAQVGDEPELRPGIVHRLDKGTSGIMIVPRDQEYFLYLKKLFQVH